MIISCPNCGVRFTVDTSAFPEGGRVVRCSKCRHEWRQETADEPAPAFAAPAPPPAVAPPPIAEAQPAAPHDLIFGSRRPADFNPAAALGAKEKGVSGLTIGWAALGILVVVVIGGVVLFQDALVGAWPPAAKLYDVLGLTAAADTEQAPRPAAKPVFETQAITNAIETIDGVEHLIIGGEIVNTGAAAGPAPPLKVSILDGDRKVLAELTHELTNEALEPGGKTSFTIQIANPPTGRAQARITVIGD